ncbi:RhuM family protein [Glaciecola sp. 33A]|jgi:hypothetical protein|uniref:RhuM family protein n=1 Tax=Glaciecola sp. 33A TaxID=2057807 RepID=UPI000C3367BD|nr:hypothetical protein CXF81_01230 [Glaciecola sp. 33A]
MSFKVGLVDVQLMLDKNIRPITTQIKKCVFKRRIAKASTIGKFRMVRKVAPRSIIREIERNNLVLTISIGYRVNSKKGIQFRIWAKQRLNDQK